MVMYSHVIHWALGENREVICAIHWALGENREIICAIYWVLNLDSYTTHSTKQGKTALLLCYYDYKNYI
jgi:hypothetical protein